MRDHVLLYINGQRREVRGEDAFLPLGRYLREKARLTGTKLVCEEGDCGACTVMVARPTPLNPQLEFKAINSCISFVHLMDGSHVVTVEGLAPQGKPDDIQQAMVEGFGSQCGFCTPGFVMALTQLYEKKKKVTEKHVRNYLTGNLCRCTGYTQIIESALRVDPKKHRTVRERFYQKEIDGDLRQSRDKELEITAGGTRFHAPLTFAAATQLLSKIPTLRPVGSATDLGVPFNKEKDDLEELMSLHQIDEGYLLEADEKVIRVGCNVSIAQVQPLFEKEIPELGRFFHLFASPQIKNNATLVGNVANGSPIADSIPPLMALDGQVHLLSTRGKRSVPLSNFYLAYRKKDLLPGEIITHLSIPRPSKGAHFRAYKVSQRKDLDISAVNGGFFISTEGGTFKTVRLALGGVAGTVIRATEAENALLGQPVTRLHDRAFVQKVTDLLLQKATPLSDVRGQAIFRQKLVENLFHRFLQKEFPGENHGHATP